MFFQYFAYFLAHFYTFFNNFFKNPPRQIFCLFITYSLKKIQNRMKNKKFGAFWKWRLFSQKKKKKHLFDVIFLLRVNFLLNWCIAMRKMISYINSIINIENSHLGVFSFMVFSWGSTELCIFIKTFLRILYKVLWLILK